MARKYLNDIGIKDNFMELEHDERRGVWDKEIEEYGFAEYETWCLRFHFYCWLYERLKMYLEVNGGDLNYHKFTYEGREYT